MMTVSPKLIPGSLGIGNSGTKLLRSPDMTNHLARVECGDHVRQKSDEPEQRGVSHDGLSAEDQL